MKFSIIATIVGAVALLPSVLGWRIPPYCSGTGPGYCNLGWEWDKDIGKTHIWVYNRWCQVLGDTDYFGWRENIMINDLPGTLWVRSTQQGPDFSYEGLKYKKENCYYYHGPNRWTEAGQCAFQCPDTQPQGLWRNWKREIEADAGPEKLFAVGVSREGMNFTEFNEGVARVNQTELNEGVEGVEGVARLNQTGVAFTA